MAINECTDQDRRESFAGLREELRQRVARPGTALARQRDRDRLRTVMQRPISSPSYQVMYLVNGRERKSAWLYDRARAGHGLRMMQTKYGERNAIINVD